jgi:outer membrane protein TolC
MVLKVKKGVRMAWVKLSFWMQAQKIIEREEREFFHLVQVTKAMLANNKAQQKDVIRAQLEHTSAQNKLINIKENINIAKNELARWIGDKEALNASPKRVPNWDAYGNRRSLLSELLQHPLLQSDSAKISSQKASIQHSKEQFKPGLTLGGGYGFRQGSNSNGSKRSDFIQLRVGVSMPVFPENRQKKLLDVSQQELLEKEATKATHYRVLKEQLNNSLTAYEQKSESMHLFETAFIPEAKQYAQSTLSAYENAQTDFPTLARAYIKQYNTEINALKANLARSFAEINLLYIKGI